MNICLVSREYPPETGWGGIGTYTYNLAHGLSKLGHDVHVIAYAQDVETEYLDECVHICRIKEKEIRGLWRFEKYLPIQPILYSIRVSKKINELIDKFKIEIVEAPEWEGEAFWLSLNKKIPLVIRFHTPLFLIRQLNSLTINLRSRVLCWLEKVTSLRADLLTSPSRIQANLIAKTYKIDLEKIKIFPNPIDCNFFRPRQKELKMDSNVLYVGRLERRKGVHILAKAMPIVLSRFSDIQFTFIGHDTETSPNGGSMKEYIRHQVAGNRHICFIDHIPRIDLIDFYQKSSVCVFPSLWECFGYTPLEALACGKPVIVTNTFGIAEFISNFVTTVPPNDPIALANAIISFFSKEIAVRNEMGIVSRKAIERVFSREIVAKDAIKAYEASIKKRNATK